MYNSQLTTFVQVADSGSFNKAAEALYISSTAVIKQINALEKHLDLTLFSRTNHGIALTESGRIIYKHARKLFAYSEKAIAEARLAAAEAATTFCVGTSILNPCKPFMDLWYRVSEQLPGFKLHIVPFEDDHEGILREIAALPLIALRRGTSTFDLYESLFRRHGLSYAPDIEAATSTQLLPLVKNGLGIAFVPDVLLPAPGIERLRLREALPERAVCLIRRTDRPRSVAAAALETMLLSLQNK